MVTEEKIWYLYLNLIHILKWHVGRHVTVLFGTYIQFGIIFLSAGEQNCPAHVPVRGGHDSGYLLATD